MSSLGERDDHHRRFWELAEPRIAAGRLVEGTMMGFPCLRSADSGGFVATVERATGNLVVKLARARVEMLVDNGDGRAFAPAGKVFREWVAIPSGHADRAALLDEAEAFVDG